jgi:hypothetical protein
MLILLCRITAAETTPTNDKIRYDMDSGPAFKQLWYCSTLCGPTQMSQTLHPLPLWTGTSTAKARFNVEDNFILLSYVFTIALTHHASFTDSTHLPGLCSVLSIQHIDESSVRRLLLIVVVPKQRRALSVERSRNPAVAVLNTLYR